MWISYKKYKDLLNRIAVLEANQNQAVEMVKNYIEDSESLSNKLQHEISKLPQAIVQILNNNC